MLPSSFFENNRTKLVNLLDNNALIVLTGNGLMQRSGDTTFPFKQDSSFYYLTGLNESLVLLVLCGGESFIVLPKRSYVEDIFGGVVDPQLIATQSGVDMVLDYRSGWDRIKKLQQSRKKVYTLGAAPKKVSSIDSFFTNPARRDLISKLKRTVHGTTIIDIRSSLLTLRQVKQPEEITIMKQAIAITKQGFEAAQKLIKPGVFEHEVEAQFDFIFKNSKAIHGYAPPIIASGKNACALHYAGGSSKIDSKDFVLLDIGAEVDGYSADISRTYAASPVTQRQQDVYDAVLRVHKQAIMLLKGQKSWRDYVIEVDTIMGRELIKLGLIKTNSREEVRRYFSHSIGHNLGLDVHDVCDYDLMLENMVVTVEPGIYIPEEGIGVRIEDDILVTKTGAVNLSSEIPYK